MEFIHQAWDSVRLESWVAFLSAVLALASFFLSRRTVRRQERMQLEAPRRSK